VRRYLPLITLPLVALGLLPVNVRAESVDTGRATANVQANGPGQTSRKGSASFGPSGTEADVSSRTQQQQQVPGVGVVGTSDLTIRPIPFNAIPVLGAPWVDQSGVIHLPPSLPGAACPPGQTGFFIYDATGALQGIQCVITTGAPAGTPASTPVQLAQQASSRQPWPNLALRVDPARGLTGLPSWFWLTGGSPTMPDVAASAGGLTVTVRATLAGVTWDFGDRGTFDSGTNVGKPFPAPGGVEHVYQTDTFGMPGGAQVSALLRFRVTYSVNGGPFTELGVKSRPYTATYVVNQLQPEAVSTP
jgi:hypothetical protein